MTGRKYEKPTLVRQAILQFIAAGPGSLLNGSGNGLDNGSAAEN